MKKSILLISLMLIGTIVAAEVNMPSAPTYGRVNVSPSTPSSYKKNTKTVPATRATTSFSTPKQYNNSMNNSITANKYTAADKKEFYDTFSSTFFDSLGNELISSGFQRNGVQMYVEQLKGRLNRTELENTTWGCVSKYSIEQMLQDKEGIVNECFRGWIENFMGKNSDLLEKHLRR